MRVFVSAVLAVLLGACATGIQVQEIGSFHVGGRPASLPACPCTHRLHRGRAAVPRDPNGDFEVEQMYVQYVRLVRPAARYPLLLWHGGGMTGVTWETTPDGRPGWQLFFLRAGHDVYVSDAVERGRASWRAPRRSSRRSRSSAPSSRRGKTSASARRGYRLDPSARAPFPGALFPVEAFDQFMKQAVPRWTSTDAATQAAYNRLVQKIGPCVILVHSQGGNFGFNAALAAPQTVKALVAIEPSGAPGAGGRRRRPTAGMPHLVVWGDNIEESALWRGFFPGSERYPSLRAAGGRSTGGSCRAWASAATRTC